MATASLSPSVLLLSKLVSLVSMSAPINRPAVWSGVDVRTLLLGSFLCLPSFLSHLHAKVQQHGTCPPQTAHMLPDLRRHPSAFLAQEIGAILIFCLVPHFCQGPPPTRFLVLTWGPHRIHERQLVHGLRLTLVSGLLAGRPTCFLVLTQCSAHSV